MSSMFIAHPTGIDSEEEEALHAKLLDVYNTIIHDWKLNCNSGELSHAVHTIQLFIMKHSLQRIGDTSYPSHWYGEGKDAI